MATYAVIAGDRVMNLIVGDDKDDAERAVGYPLIESTPDNPAGIGWTYNEETGRFSPPQIEEPAPDNI